MPSARYCLSGSSLSSLKEVTAMIFQAPRIFCTADNISKEQDSDHNHHYHGQTLKLNLSPFL